MKFLNVRIVPDPRIPHDLRVVANGECIVKVYGVQPEEPRENVANLIAAALASLDDEDSMTGVLTLTPEMQVPPDFLASRLNMWQAEYQRDLVAEVREEMRSAGIKFAGKSDLQHACELQETHPEFGDIPEDVMRQAVTSGREIGDK